MRFVSSILVILFATVIATAIAEATTILVGSPASSFGPFVTQGNGTNCRYYAGYSDYCEQVHEFNETLIEAVRFERKFKIAYGCSEDKIRLRKCLVEKSKLPDAKVSDEVADYINSVTNK